MLGTGNVTHTLEICSIQWASTIRNFDVMLVDIGQPISRRIVSSTSHGLALLLKELHEMENRKVYTEVLPSNIIGQPISRRIVLHHMDLLCYWKYYMNWKTKRSTQKYFLVTSGTRCHSSLALQLDRDKVKKRLEHLLPQPLYLSLYQYFSHPTKTISHPDDPGLWFSGMALTILVTIWFIEVGLGTKTIRFISRLFGW